MVNSLENIDKSKVYVDRIEGLDEVVEEVVDNTLIGAVSTITKSDLTAGKVLVSDNNGKVAASNKEIDNLYTAGDWIDIDQNNEISAKGSNTISLKDNVELYALTNIDTNYPAIFYTDIDLDSLDLADGTPIDLTLFIKTGINVDFLTYLIARFIYTNNIFYVNNPSAYLYEVPNDTFSIADDRFHFDGGGAIIYLTSIERNDQYDGTAFISSSQLLPTQYAVKTYVDANDNDLRSRINTKANDNTVVHLTGDETITGTKTFTEKIFSGPLEIKGIGNSPKPYIDFHTSDYSADHTSRIIEHNANDLSIEATHLHLPLSVSMKDTGIAKGTAPSNDHLNAIYWTDVNGVGIGYVYSYYKTNKENSVRMQVSKMNSASDTDYTSIGVTYPASGNPYGFCPHSDTNGSILTTYNKSKAANGYFQLGNGLIVNWGLIAFSGSSDTGSATFSKSFTSSPKVMITRNSGDTTANDGGDYYTRKITTTGFEIYRTSTNTGGCNWVAIGY